MSAMTLAWKMPNEGHLGGYDIRRFLHRNMFVGLAISIIFHVLIVGSYYLGVYLSSQGIPLPSRLIYVDPTNFGPPPSLSNEQNPTVLKVALPKMAIAVASIPKPVAGEIAPEKPLINTQQELSDNMNQMADPLAGLNGDEELKIVETIPNEAAEIPDPGVFTPYEKAPQLVSKVDPVYPPMAQTAAVGGKVTVQFYVDKNGIVKKALAVKANPAGLGFEDAAVNAVLQWKFTPALQRENPVGVWVAQVIAFKVQ